MYLNKNKNFKYKIIDIEANDLKPTQIWCCVLKDLETKEVESLVGHEEISNWFNKNDLSKIIFVGHNALSFDVPVLNRLLNLNIDLNSVCDTYVLSLLYKPALEGGHSLESWGLRLKFPKGDFSDWSKYSEEMLKYCINDVELTYKLYQSLTQRMNEYGFSEKSAWLEHRIKVIINEQIENGCYFHKERAEDFCAELRREQSNLAKQIQTLFPPVRTLVKERPFRRLKDGSLTSQYEKDFLRFGNNLEHHVIVDETGNQTLVYRCYEYQEFNLGSPKQRIEKLLELGWEPSSFTPKGQPKVDEDALVAFSKGLPEGSRERAAVEALANWLVIQGRLTMVAGNPDTGSKGWLGNVGEDHRIHGYVNPCGANSRRMIHNSPNTANIPSTHKAKYGKECRSFWGVEPGRNRVLVGYDASGLETAGLCHYLNNPSATEILLRPKPEDIHTANAKRLTQALGREVDREWGAKTSWYAWLYGARSPKLGSIVKGTPDDGDVIIETFYRNVPGLKELIDSVQKEYKKNNGRLRTIDGGWVWCPSVSAALNYKIQSMGAILMKLASIILKEAAVKVDLWFLRVLDVHDEGQLETIEDRAEELGKLAVWSIEEAGRQLKLNVPVTGSYNIGVDWSETH